VGGIVKPKRSEFALGLSIGFAWGHLTHGEWIAFVIMAAIAVMVWFYYRQEEP
jgi:hypothetical protein